MNESDDDDCFNDVDRLHWKSRPECWGDDTRMNALFAPFRSRDLNPLHYDNKLQFWKNSVASFCKENQIIQLDQIQLENGFKRKNIKPKCLEIVLNEMNRDGSIKSVNEALKPKAGLIQNIFNKVVWSPLAWSTSYVLSQTPLSFLVKSGPFQANTDHYSLSSSFTSPNTSFRPPVSPRSPSLDSSFSEHTSPNTFVNMQLLETKSLELLNLMSENVVYKNIDCVLSYDELIKTVREKILGKSKSLEKDLDLLLKYLEVNKKVLLFNEPKMNNKQFIKFTSSLNQNVSPVTQVELSYSNLKETERIIEEESNKLDMEIESINREINTCLKQQNKIQALKWLKKRKQVEAKLKTKDAAINNIQTLMMSFQQANQNKMTYDVYSESATALKEVNKLVDLNKLDDTVADLQDMMSANTEIEEVLKSPLSSKYSIDEQELNSELNELLENERLKTEKRRKLKEIDENYAASSKSTKKVPTKLDYDEHDKSFDMSGLLDSLPNLPQKIKATTN